MCIYMWLRIVPWGPARPSDERLQACGYQKMLLHHEPLGFRVEIWVQDLGFWGFRDTSSGQEGL